MGLVRPPRRNHRRDLAGAHRTTFSKLLTEPSITRWIQQGLDLRWGEVRGDPFILCQQLAEGTPLGGSGLGRVVHHIMRPLAPDLFA